MKDPIDIIWNTNIDPSGYSSCARSYIKALHENMRSNVMVRINNVARNINAQGIDPDDINFFSSISTCDIVGDNVVNHSVPDRMIFNNRKNILYTVTEMKCPERWMKICNKCNIIMTASNFCKEKMIESGIKEKIIHVVPHCHDHEIWNDEVKPLNIENLKGYNFLFIGDFTPRKNGDFLIENFLKTFRGNCDVSLTVKAYFNSFKVEDQKDLIKRIKRVSDETGIPESERPTIFFYGEPIMESLMPRFMNSFDCLISPHRGEGWGLSMSQMQFLGKPVISTRFSGNLDFMDDETSYLIDIDDFEPVCPEMVCINPNFRDQLWPILDSDSLCDLMSHVFNNQNEAKAKGKSAREKMVELFSYKTVSNTIIDILKG